MQVNKKSIAVIIPMYKSSINPNEKISLVQLLKVLSDYDILFVVPESLYFQPARLIPGNPSLETTGVIRFPDKWFSWTSRPAGRQHPWSRARAGHPGKFYGLRKGFAPGATAGR